MMVSGQIATKTEEEYILTLIQKPYIMESGRIIRKMGKASLKFHKRNTTLGPLLDLSKKDLVSRLLLMVINTKANTKMANFMGKGNMFG